jgi:hypothetical protein
MIWCSCLVTVKLDCGFCAIHIDVVRPVAGENSGRSMHSMNVSESVVAIFPENNLTVSYMEANVGTYR